MRAFTKALGIAAVVVAIAGCDAPAPPRQQAPDQTTAPPTVNADTPPPLVPALPLPDDAVAKAVGQLDRIADELMTSSGIPGMAVAVVHGGKTVYAKGFGVKDVANGDTPDNKVDPDTVFQLASLSNTAAVDRDH
jgi:CubicO group peptidase (beta-lactamase class C family)